MKWASARSPNPEFGGREATDEEIEAFDEDAHNPQYHLVFDAWDEQFEERQGEHWQPASDEIKGRFHGAMAHANRMGKELEASCTSDELIRWRETCKRSPIWRGESR